jgi:molybdopterin-guanine dinucleotide biosynthesis protein
LKRNLEQMSSHKSGPASETGMPDIAACVLAGGRSTRMGEDKRQLIFQDVTLFQRALALTEGYCPRYVSLAADDSLEEISGFTIVRDRVAGKGPLGGISEVLSMSTQPWVLFLPCDMPLFDASMLHILTERRSPNIDALFFTESGARRLFPLLLRTSAAPVFYSALESDKLKLTALISGRLRTEAVEAVDHPLYRSDLFGNINSQEDYRCLSSAERT